MQPRIQIGCEWIDGSTVLCVVSSRAREHRCNRTRGHAQFSNNRDYPGVDGKEEEKGGDDDEEEEEEEAEAAEDDAWASHNWRLCAARRI